MTEENRKKLDEQWEIEREITNRRILLDLKWAGIILLCAIATLGLIIGIAFWIWG